MGVLEEMTASIEAASEKEVVVQPGVTGYKGSYKTSHAKQIVQAVLEAYGGDDCWTVNSALIDNNGGLNSKKESRVLGAIVGKAEQKGRGVELHNGNNGPKAWMPGFSDEEAKAIFARAAELAQA